MQSGFSLDQAGPYGGNVDEAYDRRAGTSEVHDRAFLARGGRRRASTRKGPSIGKLKLGSLTSLGYSSSANPKTRRAAIHRAIKKYGKTSTLRKLNAVAVYTRRTNPAVSRIFKADVRYVQTK
jgi:hypothetical protein